MFKSMLWGFFLFFVFYFSKIVFVHWLVHPSISSSSALLIYYTDFFSPIFVSLPSEVCLLAAEYSRLQWENWNVLMGAKNVFKYIFLFFSYVQHHNRQCSKLGGERSTTRQPQIEDHWERRWEGTEWYRDNEWQTSDRQTAILADDSPGLWQEFDIRRI